MQLRPYQNQAVHELRQALRQGHKDNLYVLPTGGGKTIIFSEIARGAALKQNRVQILVHRREIMEQTLSKLFSFGIMSGQIASRKPMTNNFIQTAMVGTLVRRLDKVRRPDLIIIDECHHAIADNSWGRILNYWSEVPRIGVTATPERFDGRGLGETFTNMIQGPSIMELVNDGWLAYPAYKKPPEELIGQYHIKRGDFDKQEQREALGHRKIVGDIIHEYQKYMDGQPAICFCVSVEHSKMMAQRFESAGYSTRAVWGDMPDAARTEALGGLADGSVQIITCCDLINEGFDTPAVAGVILLRRTLSLGLFLQQVGRALRPVWPAGFNPNTATAAERIAAMAEAGKPRAYILDHVGNYYLHGHVLADRQWSLDALKRSKRGKEEPLETRTCPICYGVFAGHPKKCPGTLPAGEPCGYEWPDVVSEVEFKDFQVIQGELIEAGVDPGDAPSMAAFLARAQRMDKQKRMRALWGKAHELARSIDIEDEEQAFEQKKKLDALREAVGYKRGWTDRVWNEVMKKRA